MARALLLNATNEALCVVSARRAVVLVLKNKAETVHEAGDAFRAERCTVEVPSVLRLRRFVLVPRRAQVPVTRRSVFARDGHRCQYCERAAESIDHVVPRSRGGSHTWDNVVACCRRCNSRKQDRLLRDTDLELRRAPAAPHSSVGLLSSVASIDPIWHRYLGNGRRAKAVA